MTWGLFHRRQTKAYKEEVACWASHGYWEKSQELDLHVDPPLTHRFPGPYPFLISLPPPEHIALFTAALNSSLLIQVTGRELSESGLSTSSLTSNTGVNLSALKSSAKGALNNSSSIFIVRWAPTLHISIKSQLWVLCFSVSQAISSKYNDSCRTVPC